MSARFTPGPWRLNKSCGNESVLGPRGFMVADCAIFSMNVRGPTPEENQANARLIAASPAMYEALTDLLWYVGQIETLVYDKSDTDDHKMVVKARAALAKATGGAA